jgi:hypothetical protein
MRILADVNVPEEYVAALRGDGHDVIYSRSVEALGPEATDDEVLTYAIEEGLAILSTDGKDFGHRDAPIAIFVAPQDMTGGTVRAAVGRIESLPFDPAETDPLWLSTV